MKFVIILRHSENLCVNRSVTVYYIDNIFKSDWFISKADIIKARLNRRYMLVFYLQFTYCFFFRPFQARKMQVKRPISLHCIERLAAGTLGDREGTLNSREVPCIF